MKLVIAEKPSVAGEIAKVIGANIKKTGYYIGNDYLVSWCVGHLVETVMPEIYDERYSKWNISDLPIIPKIWKYKVTAGVQSQFNILKELMNREDVIEIICATDAGREGELIFRLVYNQIECKKNFKRLWISSMESEAINKGFSKLKEGKEYDRLYAAALCRLQADWLVGINFSRLFGCISRMPVNVGRVQTPTVNLIVERQYAIDKFDSKPFYILNAACTFDEITFNAIKRVDNEDDCKKIFEKCKGKDFKVISNDKSPIKENPQLLYDLTTLQRESNKMLGLSAQQTLDAAQNLYEKKLITYPRTDSRYLTEDMKNTVINVIRKISKNINMDGKIKEFYENKEIGIERLINDKKVTDHHAIIPTIEAANSTLNLPVNEKNVLSLIKYKLLAAVYMPHEYIKTELVLEGEGEEFKSTGRQIIQSGFKDIINLLSEELKGNQGSTNKNKKTLTEKEEDILPDLNLGDIINKVKLTSKEKFTSPPKPYTEDTLLLAMENAMKTLEDEELKKEVAGAGLGTPATRAGIIERIIKTGFVERKGKNLMPTQKAFEIVELVPDKVKSPVLTAEWEQKLEQIYKGEREGEEFITGIEKFVNELVSSYKINFDINGKEIIGICPRCGKNIYEGKINYYCESGRECNFVIWKEDKFFTEKKKPLTTPMVKAFLKKGRIKAAGLYSKKTDTTYMAYIAMVDTGEYVNFKVYFPN